MRRGSPPHQDHNEESQEIRRLAAACFLEEIDPEDLGCEDRHLIALRREVEELQNAGSSEAYLRCLTELTRHVNPVEER